MSCRRSLQSVIVNISLEAAKARLLADLAGIEPPQPPDINPTAEHQVKQELIVSALDGLDVNVKRESEAILEHQQLGDTTLRNFENDHEPALIAKSLQTPDLSFADNVQWKHETEVSSEPGPVEDAINGSTPGLKLMQKVNFRVQDLVSSCDSDVVDARALQQVVDGCFVKLQRLRLLRCDVCRRVFQKRSQLVAHVIDHHAGDDADTSESDGDSEPDDHQESDSSDTLKLYPCNICHEQFAFKCHMQIHKLKHWGKEPLTCDICQKDFAKKSILSVHMDTHFKGKASDPLKLKKHARPKRFACKHCQMLFTNRAYLIVHKRVHTGEKPYSCDICRKRFTQKSNLTNHCRKHTGEKYTCEVCNNQFSDRSSFWHHKKIHTGENLHKCGVCDRHFTKKRYLIEHTNIHEGVKANVCKICKKTFYRKDQLTRHMITHKKEKEIPELKSLLKKHECKICGKLFSQSYLVIHSRVHTGDQPYKCDICDKTFHRKFNLLRHLRYHTNAKPHTCKFCKKSFRQKCDLTVHIRIHTGEKPYKCEICKKAFSHKPNLTKHKRTYHEK